MTSSHRNIDEIEKYAVVALSETECRKAVRHFEIKLKKA